MKLKTFSTKHRLKIKLDECGDAVVQGKFGTIYEYSDSLLGMTFMPPTAHKRPWTRVQQAILAAGMTITQNGDAEGAASFDGANLKQAKLAIATVKARAKRVVSPETKERLRNQLASLKIVNQDSL